MHIWIAYEWQFLRLRSAASCHLSGYFDLNVIGVGGKTCCVRCEEAHNKYEYVEHMEEMFAIAVYSDGRKCHNIVYIAIRCAAR